MTYDKILKKHEGFRTKLYKDTKGIYTIGVGRNIQQNGIREIEAEFMLKNDIEQAISDLKHVFQDFDTLPDNVKLVLVDMMFNLGSTRFSKFKHMIQAVKERNWANMILEMRDSNWCRELKDRCNYDAALIQELVNN